MQPDPNPGDVYDVVYVGAGVSTAFTLLRFIDELESQPLRRAVRVAVVEQSGAEFGGVPYSTRTAPTSLIITSLRDFLPEIELAPFVAWLSANKDSLLADLEAVAGSNTTEWLRSNEQATANDEWLDLYVPRRFFGRYINERVDIAIERAVVAGLLHFEFVVGRVQDVQQSELGYAIAIAGRAPIETHVAVLAVGSMPLRSRFDNTDTGTCVIDDLYVPDQVSNLLRVSAAVQASARPRVLVVGANASALESLYTLNDLNEPKMRSVTFHILSPTAEFPERATPSDGTAIVPTESLDELAQVPEPPTAEELYLAASSDLRRIREQGITVTESLPATARAVGALVGKLTRTEKLNFARRWGVALGKQQRRAGIEYSDNVQSLFADGRLVVHAGSFSRLVAADGDQGGVRAEYTDATGTHALDYQFDAVINCAGFAAVDELLPDSLVAHLVSSESCGVVSTGPGIVVNDRMEAAPRLFVMGPMLAGNIVNDIAIWHVEHCGRISMFSKALASTVHAVMSEIAATPTEPSD